MELKNFFAQDDQGNKLPGATCYLYRRGTENLVGSVFKANGLPLANPFTTDNDGLVQLAAPNGIYDLRVVTGGRDYRLHIQFNDVSETVAAAQTAADRAETAKDSAVISAGIKDDIAHGLRTTSPGENFQTLSVGSNEYVSLYKNKGGGVAQLLDSYPNKNAITELGIENQSSEVTGLAFTVVDEDGRRLWLEAKKDGRPSDWAYQLIAEGLTPDNCPLLVAGAAAEAAAEVGFGVFNSDVNDMSFVVCDEDDRQTELAVGKDGRLLQRVIDSIASRIGAATVVPPFPVKAWACWGDSLTAGGWPTTLAALSGWPVMNGGWGGQTASQIAAREGGVPAQLTVSGDIIPASGAVTITAVLNNPLSDGGSRKGTLAGVLGTLAMAGDVLSFTRVVNGVAVACPAKSYFTPADGIAYADRHVTIWIGRNSFKSASPAYHVATVRAMIDYLTPRVKRVIVMSIPPWAGEEIGDPIRPKLDNCNAALAAAFPEYWLDIAAWLRTTEAATAAGITFTADDVTDINNGLTPRSLRMDAGHLNTIGNNAIAYRVYQESKTRGWV